ncbi:hypothetical protein [uncultured Mediterranean phage]|nr:hypothetical protein [uncultured Mediterranean phage]
MLDEESGFRITGRSLRVYVCTHGQRPSLSCWGKDCAKNPMSDKEIGDFLTNPDWTIKEMILTAFYLGKRIGYSTNEPS